VLDSHTRITDRAALLAATGDHPFARLTTQSGDVLGLVGEATTVWVGDRRGDPLLGAIGDGPAALDVVVALHRDGTIGVGARAELPRMDHAVVAAAYPNSHVIDWDLRWLTAEPPITPGEDRVVTLGPADFDEIDAILDAALADPYVRPGASRARAWYGIRDGADLVAVAADTSTAGFGFLNSIAVRPDRHGHGFGSAITCYLARRQRAVADVVLLGVMADNIGASRLYHRLGYAGLHEMTAFTLR
jgi:ribosomal protein S18 acetylase RimI-like enzyme